MPSVLWAPADSLSLPPPKPPRSNEGQHGTAALWPGPEPGPGATPGGSMEGDGSALVVVLKTSPATSTVPVVYVSIHFVLDREGAVLVLRTSWLCRDASGGRDVPATLALLRNSPSVGPGTAISVELSRNFRRRATSRNLILSLGSGVQHLSMMSLYMMGGHCKGRRRRCPLCTAMMTCSLLKSQYGISQSAKISQHKTPNAHMSEAGE